MTPVLSPTQNEVVTALRGFLLATCAGSDPTQPFEVVLGQVNRAPEPAAPDYIVITPYNQMRLATNETDYADTIVDGSVVPMTVAATGSCAVYAAEPSLGLLTVTATTGDALAVGVALGGVVATGTTIVSQVDGDPGGVGDYLVSPAQTTASGALTGTYGLLNAAAPTRGALVVGQALLDETGALAAGTVVLSQLSGLPGSVGTYPVSVAQTVFPETMYQGQRRDDQATEFRVQLDVHGPRAADNAQVVTDLFFAEYGTDFFAATGLDLAPLHCTDPHQTAFVNAEQQYEDRWTLEAVLQVNARVTTGQQFADTVTPTVVEAATQFTGAP